MKLILDVKEFENPQKDDIIKFDGNFWVKESKINFVAPFVKEVQKLQNGSVELCKDYNNFADTIRAVVKIQDEKIARLEKIVAELQADIKYLKGE